MDSKGNKQKILSHLCHAEGNNTGAVTLVTSPQDLLHCTAYQNHLLLVREQTRDNSGPEWKASRRPKHGQLTLDRGTEAMERKQTVALNVKSAEARRLREKNSGNCWKWENNNPPGRKSMWSELVSTY